MGADGLRLASGPHARNVVTAGHSVECKASAGHALSGVRGWEKIMSRATRERDCSRATKPPASEAGIKLDWQAGHDAAGACHEGLRNERTRVRRTSLVQALPRSDPSPAVRGLRSAAGCSGSPDTRNANAVATVLA